MQTTRTCDAAILFGIFVLALSISSTDAVYVRGAASKVPNHKNSLMKLDTSSFRINSTDLAALAKLPGAGASTEEIKKELKAGDNYKDGFLFAGCFKDYMYYHGDKFGKNKHSYELGAMANVSVVFPLEYVKKEDREPMTVQYCYGFCRQLKDMLYFGLLNGRECYCAPYLKPMPDDDSLCNAVCEGETDQVCGSKTKSTTFQMHKCDRTKDNLKEAMDELDDLIPKLEEYKKLDQTGQAVISISNRWQEEFGKVGDPATSDLFQEAIGAGRQLQSHTSLKKFKMTATTNAAAAAELLGVQNFNKAANLNKVDKIMVTLKADSKTAEDAVESMEKDKHHYLPAIELPEVPTNVYTKNSNLGDGVGKCKCPNGETYYVGDHGDSCASLACAGGEASDCKMEAEWGDDKDKRKEGGLMQVSCGTGRPKSVAEGASIQYYPIMYFIDKEFEMTPTTCSGKPMPYHGVRFGVTKDECAYACDREKSKSCMAFLYVPSSGKGGHSKSFYGGPDSECFLFETITDVQYYTKKGCQPSEIQCYGKLSALTAPSGNTVSPLDSPAGAVNAESQCMPATGKSKTSGKSGKSKTRGKSGAPPRL